MPNDDRPSSALQESIITALSYGGKEAAIISTVVTLDHFDPVYRNIAARVIDYRHRMGEAPGEGHLDDVFDDILSDKDHKQYSITHRVLTAMREQVRHLNIRYVIDRVRDFARTQTLKNGIMAAAERWQGSETDRIPDVERILNDTLKDRGNVIDPGTFFTDFDRVLAYQDKSDSDYFLTNIKELDTYGFGPHIGEIDVFIAPPKKGKSWWCHHLGKQATLQYWPTLHITLENAETVANPRYLQSYFALAKRPDAVRGVYFKQDEYGNFDDIVFRERKPSGLVSDANLRSKFKFEDQYFFDYLVVKRFPTGSLTIRMLENYLDYLDAYKGFQPKLVILDAPYLMKLDRSNYRLDLGQTFVELRGLAGQREFALATTHQGNRESSEARQVTSAHIAEDFSIIATCDRAITYSQTKQEKRLGMARLFASNSRNDADQFTVMIAQNYAAGQFSLDSVRFKEMGYFDKVDTRVGDLDRLEQGKKDDD